MRRQSIPSSYWDQSYWPLPLLFLVLFVIWVALAGAWTANTWSKRRWQTSNLQWVLTIVPILKALVLGLSFVFWYSCLNLSSCSFWVAFGVFVSRIFFETTCFTVFLLISHGYCIINEQLPLLERRSIAALTSVLYLILTGYKAAIPQFLVLVVLMYIILLYIIFSQISRNLSILKEQLQYVQDEGVHVMQTAICAKYNMFKKFQGAMFVIVVVEILMHSRPDGVANEYWMRLVVREWIEIGMFVYIGWTFRSREMTPFFTTIPALRFPKKEMLPPIYRIEINEKDFNSLNFEEWHIGVPTSPSKGRDLQMLVIVQNPGGLPSSHSETTGLTTTRFQKPSTQHTRECAPALVPSYQTGDGLAVSKVGSKSRPYEPAHSYEKIPLISPLDSTHPHATDSETNTPRKLQLSNGRSASNVLLKDVAIEVKSSRYDAYDLRRGGITPTEEIAVMPAHFQSNKISTLTKMKSVR